MTSEYKDKKLFWACRRGMLELDMLFQTYLLHRYPHLNTVQQQLFHKLLEQQDPDLFAAFMSGKSLEDDTLTWIVEDIKSYADTYKT